MYLPSTVRGRKAVFVCAQEGTTYGFRRGRGGEVAGICSDGGGSGVVFSHPGSDATCPAIEDDLLITWFALL